MTNGYLTRRLPAQLSDLAELALDLRWTTSSLTRRIWSRLDPETWERTENPYLILINAPQSRLEEAAADPDLLQDLASLHAKISEYKKGGQWFGAQHSQSGLKRIAYFSMEFGLSEALPIYSGGLGILAGDHLKSASDLGVPLVGIGILYQQGYFRQVLADDGSQLQAFPYNDPSSLPVRPLLGEDGHWLRVQLELPGRTLYLRIWQAQVGRVTLYLLDSNDPLNGPWDRGITANLYDAGRDKRLLQEIVLGVGGWRLVELLGIEVDVCHLNEGHAAFGVLARAASYARRFDVSVPVAFRATRVGNVFTTHTPVAAAFDRFDPMLIAHFARPFTESLGVPMDIVLALGRANPADTREPFNMAYLAMRGCCHANAVSKLHGRVSRKLFGRMFPGWPETQMPVKAITNGVHIPTWGSLAARKLWVKAADGDGWLRDLDQAGKGMMQINPVDIWQMRAEARQSLVDYVRRRLTRQLQVRGASPADIREAGHVLDPNTLTLGFARRFAEYKRPNLMLRDANRLKRLLLDSSRPVQLIVAGKAHPNDEQGKSMVRSFARFVEQRELRSHVVFLEDYDMVLGQHLVAGIDVWINTPRRPAEACGTSGMKILFNGGLNLSVRDGWWDEACSEEVGWQIGDGEECDAKVRDDREAAELYRLLEQQVVPEFYQRDAEGVPRRWLKRLQTSMSRLTMRFSSDRMVKEYVERAYLPAAAAVRRRIADGAKLGRELYDWHLQLVEHWRGLHFGDVDSRKSNGCWKTTVKVCLGELSPEMIQVELFAEPLDGEEPVVIPMARAQAIPGAVNSFVFTADAPANRPPEHYTPRVVPWHPDAFLPTEESRILWQR